ncbi:RagB/SusD family nutrient uptake outer membrane protein [Leptobacterium sp. I13]|uniref:RagB/SusD family nutrient uptake outer membrane protein n=1 Tax=Leptobacterium meishanense TaxID=3128904 RepID=UPI0030ED68A6
MKTIYRYSSFFLFATLLLIGCADNLDIEPEQSLSPDVATSTPENVQRILIGTYDEAGQTTNYGGRINLASELLANSGDLAWRGTFAQPFEMNFKAITVNNTFVASYWTGGYEIINQANIVLASLNVFEDPSESDRVEGEAKFLRGLTYFDLARLFGQNYVPGQQNNQLAVPLVLEAVTDASQITFPSRNTVEEIYAQVISDLTDAMNLLPSSNAEFADSFSAEALLARVYLQMGDYANARDAANNVIQNSGHTLAGSFAGAFNNDSDSVEDLFAWQITSQDGTNNMNTFWAGNGFGGRIGNPDVAINASHFSIYDDPNNDERASFFYVPGGTATTKWISQFANIPHLRLAEMYLIRAESNFRLGTNIGATPLADVNTLRNRSGATALGTVVLQDIIDERRRELSFEGFALHDIKRLGENVGALPPTSDALVLPVPQRERDANPNLDQNPGY